MDKVLRAAITLLTLMIGIDAIRKVDLKSILALEIGVLMALGLYYGYIIGTAGGAG